MTHVIAIRAGAVATPLVDRLRHPRYRDRGHAFHRKVNRWQTRRAVFSQGVVT
jgi:hypothetical protein